MHTHITRAHLKGYRNIRNTEATFREGLNIIIGKNGTGKSNFLWLLANISKDEINDTRISAEIEGSIEFYKEGFQSFLKKITHEYNENAQIEKKINTSLNKKINSDKRLYFLSFNLLKFNIPTEIDAFSKPKSIYGTIGTYNNVKNLMLNTNNAVLRKIIGVKKFSETYQFAITDLNFEQDTINILKKYTPIQDVRVEFPQRADEIKIFDDEMQISNLLYGFKTNNNEWFKWEDLSDGTRRIVWIILNVLTTDIGTILIEEPELGIHPHQLALLMDFIKDQSQHKQIIITTHSPEVLDVLDSNELDRIKVARYDEELKTTVIDKIPTEDLPLIAEYMQETGLLSGYWSRLGGLESKPSMR